MKKLIVVITLLFAGRVSGQDFGRYGFSLGPELNIPSRSIYSIGYGGTAKADFRVAGHFGGSVSGGYTTLVPKSPPIGYTGAAVPHDDFVPLKAGVRYTAGPGVYLEAEGGYIMETSGAKENFFGFALGPGFLFRVSDHQSVELGLRYEQWSRAKLTQTAIRVAYRLGW